MAICFAAKDEEDIGCADASLRVEDNFARSFEPHRSAAYAMMMIGAMECLFDDENGKNG